MKKTILILLCFFLIACTPKVSKENKLDSNIHLENSTKECKNQNENDKNTTNREKIKRQDIEKVISPDNLEKNLKKITSTHRKRGTKENYLAGDYICSKMKENGYNVYFQDFNAYDIKLSDAFKAVSKENIVPAAKNVIFKGRNIIAKRKDFKENTPMLIISAHYDTTKDNIGAIDNGAAVCALIETSRILEYAKLNYEPVFVFFDSEEYRLFGSRYFIYDLSSEERENIYGNFNVDMIGNLKARKIMMVDGSEDEFYKKALKIFPDKNIEKTDLGQSDDSSFYYNHIKKVRYTTADFKSKEFNKDWLGIESDTSSIDLNSLLEDVSFIANYLNELELE